MGKLPRRRDVSALMLTALLLSGFAGVFLGTVFAVFAGHVSGALHAPAFRTRMLKSYVCEMREDTFSGRTSAPRTHQVQRSDAEIDPA